MVLSVKAVKELPLSVYALQNKLWALGSLLKQLLSHTPLLAALPCILTNCTLSHCHHAADLITDFSLEILAFYLSDSCLLAHLSSTVSVHFSVDPKVIITLAVLHHRLVRAWQLILADYNQPCPHLSLSLYAVVEHDSFYISKWCAALGVNLLSETTCTDLCTVCGFGGFMTALAWSCRLNAH